LLELARMRGEAQIARLLRDNTVFEY
jgi:hypothetical protein